MHPSIAQVSNEILEIKRLRESIVQAILDLPDNPNIQRLKEHPRCFIMSSKEAFSICTDMRVTNNISVFYHDFKAQYELITEVVNGSHIENIIPTLRTITETGKYRKEGYYYTFHPTVLTHLKTLLSS
jgi:hypothetical protein